VTVATSKRKQAMAAASWHNGSGIGDPAVRLVMVTGSINRKCLKNNNQPPVDSAKRVGSITAPWRQRRSCFCLGASDNVSRMKNVWEKTINQQQLPTDNLHGPVVTVELHQLCYMIGNGANLKLEMFKGNNQRAGGECGQAETATAMAVAQKIDYFSAHICFGTIFRW